MNSAPQELPGDEGKTAPRYDVTTLGEIMLRLSVPAGSRLETAAQLDVRPGGAEANLVALLARLGRRTAWLGGLPDNALGRLAANHLRMAGVDLRGVHWCGDGRMGTYFVEFSAPPRPIQVIYDRADSCATQLTPDTVNWETLLATRLLHLTGITPALSPSCSRIVTEAVERARHASVAVSLDVNYRQKLWSAQEATEALTPLLRQADLLFCGHGDAQRLFHCTGDPPGALRQLAEQTSAEVVVMSVGSAGALAWYAGQVLQADAVPVAIVDRLGAGDALAAGVIDGWLDGNLTRGLHTGTLLAGLALAQHGDMVVTTRQEVESLLKAAANSLIVR
jgi:2-dehydro-3-deoxygluconokinase